MEITNGYTFSADTCTGCHSLWLVLLIQDKPHWNWQRWNMPTTMWRKNNSNTDALRAVWKKGRLNKISVFCLINRLWKHVQYFTFVGLCWIWVSLLVPWRQQWSLSCVKPTHSCHESLQGYVVTETGANLQARNTFKFLPWPDSAKSLEPVT